MLHVGLDLTLIASATSMARTRDYPVSVRGLGRQLLWSARAGAQRRSRKRLPRLVVLGVRLRLLHPRRVSGRRGVRGGGTLAMASTLGSEQYSQ
jgi:hypothetical protein